MKAVILLLVLFAHIINAFADRIDHGKGNRTLKTLWHIAKFAQLSILIGIILFLLNVSWQVWFLFWAALWIWWEFCYYFFGLLNVSIWDDLFDWQWLKKIWRY